MKLAVKSKCLVVCLNNNLELRFYKDMEGRRSIAEERQEMKGNER